MRNWATEEDRQEREWQIHGCMMEWCAWAELQGMRARVALMYFTEACALVQKKSI